MISNTLVRKAVQVEYTLLRTPLAVVNRGLASRLGSGSRVRLTVERGLGALDAVAGQWLSGQPHGQAAADPAKPPAAAQPAKSPAAADVPADGDVEPTHDQVELTHDDQVERVVEEILEEQEQKPLTGELADPDLQEVQAELRAKHAVEQFEEEQRIKREHDERVRVAEAARTAPARKATAVKDIAKKAPAKKTPAKTQPAAKKAPAKKAGS